MYIHESFSYFIYCCYDFTIEFGKLHIVLKFQMIVFSKVWDAFEMTESKCVFTILKA